MSVKIHYQNTHFITSAPDIRHLPDDEGIEIAFAGRSNAGKSSSLNRLTNQKSLAKTSKTPGRTQLINLFKVTEGCHIVDLPGYGFAQVPLELKKKWQKSLGEYLQKRKCLKGLVVLMDIRHPMKDLDQQLISWAVDCDIPVLVLLTKADKLKSGARKAQVLKIREEAHSFGGDVTVDAFSSLKGLGVDVLRNKLDTWFAPALAHLAEQETVEEMDEFDSTHLEENPDHSAQH
ncbi:MULTISPECIES: ribosome biogenesis GTP-binding protein YihA/YsxC [unclassified Vibrio]|uniref:ribosome biogenesis GTP-binding protein YihA/YsxC n=1 Tax=unclassified Vibrio TaxID=2614977 RepID=UPI000B8E2796|nr:MULTISPECIES: ribosome biogenesis GTP-binding protein YihA/YsxC [unclassified Vibrio]NAW90429.1 YihA family ribosome biogenesis GTP-binding protein [Vibrio sp. V24_P1S3T111]OXX19355.1 YihA family ribosome biogenesis GTP-binding protein [Vibrio sp. V06_P1A73T115]OXX19726.1 YihA family ribosome biogenesis GTP-binding protein [Vibrio sp. V05_P4A8T149]OXX34205.1 YihA family ribosome biogenesis GTP-binding protein [Vibrio sp. V14_P6S14T42]OXX36014.1 YihA family ribosome biogenesis GTP-binding pr